jgi:hypothetical protein
MSAWVVWVLACGAPTGSPAPEPGASTAGPGTATTIEAVEAVSSVAERPLAVIPEFDAPALLVNEVMTRNDASYMTPQLTFPDWFELVNSSAEEIDLGRVTVEDGSGATWRGPAGDVLAPGAVVLITADDEGVGPYVAPFGLSSDGDTLEVAVDGVTTDRIATGVLVGDQALARWPDGEAWAVQIFPTPGWSNVRPSESVNPKDALYTQDRVIDVYLWITAENIQILNGGSWPTYPSAPGDMMVDGAFFPDVSLKRKGKPALKVDVNELVPGRRLRGVKGLTLNNGTHDETWTHEALTAFVYANLGIPSARVGWARLWVNDELYGLYMNVESIDDLFLEDWYQDPDGALYEGNLDDFGPSQWGGTFDYEEGPEPEDRAVVSDVDAIVTGPTTDDAYEVLKHLVDMPQFHRYMAVEAIVMHWDGYKSPNNYRFYHDPVTDLIQFIPSGTDFTWTIGWSDTYGPYRGFGNLFQWCLDTPACLADYERVVLETCDEVEKFPLVDLFDEWTAMLDPDILADPRTAHSPPLIAAARVALVGYLTSQVEAVRSEVLAH